MKVWDTCNGQAQMRLLRGTLYRLVEDQEQVATLGYVDTLDEQALLEELLDDTKPPYPTEIPGSLHYLLKTPFRYPPLKWGSRFGSRSEPSIFYGGCSVDVTLAEVAYYRFVFWDSMESAPTNKVLKSQHTMFCVEYRTEKGISLHQPPFDDWQADLTNKTEYAFCQSLGSDMRAAGVQAFEYCSARDVKKRTCVGLFSPEPFTSPAPTQQIKWLCECDGEVIRFKSTTSSEVITFYVADFLMDGRLPIPA